MSKRYTVTLMLSSGLEVEIQFSIFSYSQSSGYYYHYGLHGTYSNYY